MEPLLDIRNLSISFRQYGKGLTRRDLQVILSLCLTISAGEIVAVAGASGSGKSLLAHAVLGLLPGNAVHTGHMRFGGQELTPELQCQLRGEGISLIPQSVAYLDPLMQVEQQVWGHKGGGERTTRQQEAFRRLGLADRVGQLYPFQLSGGMARRVLFSTAFVDDAQLIIADEPTPGMSPDQAVEALSALRELADRGKGVLLITHDIDLAVRFADRVAVFYAGTTVEEAPACDFQGAGEALRHPYSKALWCALPQNGFQPIAGFQPSAGALPPGCLFAPRCALCTEDCHQELPPMRPVRGGKVRCIHGA